MDASLPIFLELATLLGITTLITIVVKSLKQPLVVGYILSGIIAGPSVFNILSAEHELELFSKVGIVFLLFIVGLHLNPKVIREVGNVSLITGLGQVLITSGVGFVIAVLLGIDRIAALYVAIALTFSSTIIILKLLADKKDLQKLYAKIAIGFLLVQDLVATLILISVAVLAQESSVSLAQTIGFTLLKGLGVFILLIAINHYIIKRLTNFLAQSQELLFLFSLSWGIGLASIFAFLGFSVEIGALIAGVVLSATPFADEMASRLKPLRDFFIIIFFLLLGSQMILGSIGAIIVPALVLSLFVLIGNPIIVIVLMNLLGYNKKTGFMAGLTVAQISEFSLILASLGFQVGHLPQETLSLITLVGLITIAGSTYLILYAESIYPKLQGVLKHLELIKRKNTHGEGRSGNYSSILFGYDRVGNNFVKSLAHIGEDFLVVDFNPASIERLTKADIPVIYGDASDVEFLDELPIAKPRMCISTIPDTITNSIIIKHMKRLNPKAILLVIAHTLSDAQSLYDAGATYVIMPHHLGSEYASRLIRKYGTKHSDYLSEKEKHFSSLKKYGLK